MQSNFDSSRSESSLHLFSQEHGRSDDGHGHAGLVGSPAGIFDPIDQSQAAGDEVLSIEELASRFNVSTKTISRWRDHGLVAQRHFAGGRRRVGFLASAVERFIQDNPLRIERGSRFSQLSQDEHDRIVGWARRLASAGACPADVHRRIASRLNRSVETIRYTIKRHDQEHPSEAVFPVADGRLRPESCERIYHHYQSGETVESIAKRYHRSKASIYRVILSQRAEHISQLPLECMPNALFSRKSAESVVNQPFPGLDEPAKRMRRPSGLPAYLASLYEVPLLTREQEVWLFRKFNYLKHKASTLRAELDLDRPNARSMGISSTSKTGSCGPTFASWFPSRNGVFLRATASSTLSATATCR